MSVALSWRRLRVAELPAEAVVAVLDVVAAARRPVLVEVDATAQEIAVRLAAPSSIWSSLEATLVGLIPQLLCEPDERSEDPGASWHRAWWPGRLPLLRTEAPERSIAALLGALSAVSGPERLRLVVRLQPGWLARPQGDVERAVKEKLAGPLLQSEILIGVTATPPVRAKLLVRGVATALRTRSGERSVLRLRRVTGASLARSLGSSKRLVSWSWLRRPTTVLFPAELVGVLGLPVGSPVIRGLSYAVAPRLNSSASIPTSGAGRVFGVADDGSGRALVQPVAGAVVHSLLAGPSGVGKSNLLTGLALDDIAQGRGVVYLDLKGEIDGLLSRIPAHRRDHVVVLEPGSGRPTAGLRLMRGEAPELAADMLLGTLRGVFAESWGVRSDQYLGLGLRAVAHDPDGNLADLPVLFADPVFRRRVLARGGDRRVQAEFAAFEALSAAQAIEHLASPLNKVSALLSRPAIRTVVAQERPKLDLAAALERRKVVVVGLSTGRLGASAQLIASLVLWELYAAVLARPHVGLGEADTVGIYLDEPTMLAGLPVPLGAMFELFRSKRAAVTMTTQSVSQLPTTVQRAVLANASTVAVFKQNAQADAKLLAGQLGTVSAEQLLAMRRYQVALRLALANGHHAPLATGDTRPLPDPVTDPDALRDRSAARYGRTLADVDAALDRRHGLGGTPEDGEREAGDEALSGRRRRG